MKIKDGYIKFKSYDGWVITPIGNESKKNKVIITLNETAAEIWDMLKEEKDADEIAKAFSEKYGISFDRAKNDVSKIVEPLIKKGILTE